jgi:hypothetical protein
VSTVLVASLFLPWQRVCYPQVADLRAAGVAGRCLSTNGLALEGSTVLGLTVAITMVLVLDGGWRSAFALATAVSLLVATLGFDVRHGNDAGIRYGFGYGSILGFCAAAVLIVLVLASRLPPASAFRCAWPRLTGAVLSLLLVAVVVVPWWGVLPSSVWSVFAPGLARVTWLSVGSALLGIRLASSWFRQDDGESRELVLLSFALLVLAVLETVSLPTLRPSWNSAVLVGLSAMLTVLALVERRGGIRAITVPEILRIDRISV